MLDLPHYSDPRGPEFRFQAPFRFSDVRVTAFPLRASIHQLQRLCDCTLNRVPPSVAQYRVSAPMVFLMLLDYGRLSANEETHFGAFAQRELLFMIPLEQYQLGPDGWNFRGFSSFAPFIYVDDSFSMHLGRTVMGWRKAMVSFAPQDTGWLRDPAGTIADLSVSAEVCDKPYEGESFRLSPVMQVLSRRPDAFRYPIDPGAPFATWEQLARGVTGVFDTWSAAIFHALSSPTVGTAFTPKKVIQMLRAFSPLGQRGGGMVLSSVNLKQFRKASEPTLACYQALTSAPVRYGAVSEGGLLGNPLVDPSGGYEIAINNFPTFCVVEQLGLAVETPVQGAGPQTVCAKPLYPFWYRVNIEYGSTKTLAYRSSHSDWCDPAGRRIQEKGAEKKAYYDNYTRLGSPVMTGPFWFRDSNWRLFPLVASKSKLQEMIDRALNDSLDENHGYKVAQLLLSRLTEPSAPEPPSARSADQLGDDEVLVYLAVIQWGPVTSLSNNVADWGDTSLSFLVPVRSRKSTGENAIKFFPAYSFARGVIHTCTWTELLGIPTNQVELESPQARDGHIFGDGHLMEVFAQTLPALYEGQMAMRRPLLTLDVSDESEEREKGNSENLLSREERRVQFHTFKQFRDSDLLDKACYQALVKVPFSISRLSHAFRVDSGATLVIEHVAQEPIVETLGLKGENIVQGGMPATEITTLPWLFLRGDIRVENGQEICERLGTTWQYPSSDDSRPDET